MSEHKDTTGITYLRTREAASYLGVSPRTLEKWRCTGGGPKFRKLGAKLVVYTQEDLDSFAESRCFKSTAQFPKTYEGMTRWN